MTSRREFIGQAVAASLVAGLGGASLASATSDAAAQGKAPLYKAVFDSRFADGLRYARQAKRLGIATHAITGDITDLWFNDLDLRWRQAPVAIAGLTTEAALFCLEQLAWNHRLRVVFRAEHQLLASGCRQHIVACARAASPTARTGDFAAPDWAERLANVQLAAPWRTGSWSRVLLESPSESTVDAAGFLVSWVIAPPVRG